MATPLNIIPNLIITIITLGFLIQQTVSSEPSEFQFERIELKTPSYVEKYYNISEIRITKYNRTTYVLNLHGEFFVDFDEEFFLEIFFYFNRLNNNQYTKSPAHIKKPFCEVLRRFYKNYIMGQLQGYSNFPQLEPDEDVCPIERVRNSYET